MPRFNHRELDIFKLYKLVQSHGGYDSVCVNKVSLNEEGGGRGALNWLHRFYPQQGQQNAAPKPEARVHSIALLLQLWARVGRAFNPPKSMTNLSFHMRRLYERCLLAFERVRQHLWCCSSTECPGAHMRSHPHCRTHAPTQPACTHNATLTPPALPFQSLQGIQMRPPTHVRAYHKRAGAVASGAGKRKQRRGGRMAWRAEETTEEELELGGSDGGDVGEGVVAAAGQPGQGVGARPKRR